MRRVLPFNPAGVVSQEDDAAEEDAVVGEGEVGFGGDEFQKGFDGEHGGEEGGGETDGDEDDVFAGEGVVVFEDVVEGGGHHHGYGEEEGEFGGGFALYAPPHAAHDGAAGTGGAGDEGEDLGEADDEGVLWAHVVHAFDARLAARGAFFYPHDGEAAQDEGEGDADGVEEGGFNLFAEQETGNGGGDEGDGEVEGEAVGGGIAADVGDDVGEAAAVFKQHGEDGAQLDGDFKDFFFAVEVQKGGEDDEVPRAGNRQEFGEAFDDAEDEGFENEGDVHGGWCRAA